MIGLKFDSNLTVEDHVPGIFSRISKRIGIFRLVKRTFVETSVFLSFYFAFLLPIPEHCFPVWGSAPECHLQLMSATCIRWPSSVPIRVSCRCVIDVVWLGLVWCTILNRTKITVYLVCFLLFMLEFDIHGLRPQLIHWSLKYVSRCRTSQFVAGSFLPDQFGM